MNESIYTIPISEVFEEKCGCPICSMVNTLEERSVTYIMGAAMMEPNIRIETNKLGFCEKHYAQMLKQRNRLSLALMLETHLAEIKKNVLNGKTDIFIKNSKAKKIGKLSNTCFVCQNIDRAVESMIDNMFNLYEKEKEFRQLVSEQETFCLKHYDILISIAEQKLSKDKYKMFNKVATELVTKYLNTLCDDVSHFCKMFDYRNAGPDADWGNSKDSIERAIWFLTAYKY